MAANTSWFDAKAYVAEQKENTYKKRVFQMVHYRKMSYPSLIKEHEQLVRTLSTSKKPAIRRLYHAQKRELAEYKHDYNKIKKKQ